MILAFSLAALARCACRNKKSLNSKNDGLQGNTETHCVQTTVFLILKVVVFCPMDRLVSKSFANHTALRRLLPYIVLHPASSSKQELVQLLRGQLKGKCGNSLRSDNRISNPPSWPCRPCGPLRSQKFCRRRRSRRLTLNLQIRLGYKELFDVNKKFASVSGPGP